MCGWNIVEGQVRPSQLIDASDMAMYEAKLKGRNRIEFAVAG